MKKTGDIFDNEFVQKTSRFGNKSKVISKFDEIDNQLHAGVVISQLGKNYLVKLVDISYDEPLQCVAAGKLSSNHENSKLIAIGDNVRISLDKDSDKNLLGRIELVEDRESWLSRKSIYGAKEDIIGVNADIALIIVASTQPNYNKRLIDRIIVSAEIGNLEPIICINKFDIAEDKDYIEEDVSVYNKLGYKVYFTSFINNFGVDNLLNQLKGKCSILIGPSGVGKSTFINNIMKKDIQKILEISDKHMKGKHTTSYSRLFKLDETTSIIDTPGIREFGLINITPEELGLYFRDFSEYYDKCKFMPCTHTHEPNCEIIRMVDEGVIDGERYISYVNIIESISK